MRSDFAAAMARATAATRAGHPMEATRIITQALGGRGPAAETAPTPTPPTRRQRLDENAEFVEPLGAGTVPPEHAGAALGRFTRRLRKPLREVVRTLREGKIAAGFQRGGGVPDRPTMLFAPPVPDGARFEERHFACAAGARNYKLYVPAAAARDFVIMLHGCKQDPDDFALGTNMNTVAEARGLVVVYPRQTSTDNLSACWNWFRPGDQRRDQGEPAIIAGITREVAAEFGIDPARVYVAGLSAGGAMAAVMAEAYPDLYAAVGIHSGLPTGAANDVMSAFAAMRGEAALAEGARTGALPEPVRAIVFHGDADRTVHPSNAERIVAGRGRTARREAGRTERGRGYSRTVVAVHDGAPETELWILDGAGHAWSGGHPAGSYTDPSGPDASAEMARFFLAGT